VSRTDKRVHAASALFVAASAVVMWRLGWGSVHWWAFPAMVAAVALS
jgi:hypothetical protein